MNIKGYRRSEYKKNKSKKFKEHENKSKVNNGFREQRKQRRLAKSDELSNQFGYE